MRIRSQLAILVVAVVAPVALLAGYSIERLWDLQRKAYENQFLERVSALRLALDSEIDGTVRTLRTLARIPDMEDHRAPGFSERFRRLLANNPMWSSIGLVRPDGGLVTRLDRDMLPADATLDAKTLAASLELRRPVVSDLLTTGGGKVHMTFVALPVNRSGTITAVLYIGVDNAAWLEYLRRYPVSEQATLTLNDRNGRVIARTLNNERWVGKQSSPQYWERTLGRDEDAFINTSLEGEKFYSAFSRSRAAGWVLGTGAPQSGVEAALRGPTIALVALVIIAASLVIFFALFFGRRITVALTSLAAAARAASTAAPLSDEPLPIDEAETVRRALQESSALLRAREASLSQALYSEAQARGEAERASKAKDELLAMLGHELRNPVSAMTSAATLLQMAYDKSDVAQRARDILQRQLRHLTGIIDDMLDVARLTSGKIALNKEVLDLAQVTRHVLDSFRDSGRCAHLQVDTRFAETPVYADETRLEQVVANLLDNACKYTPPGRNVWIEVGADEGKALLTVRDNGTGIPPELLPHVFDIFAQGPRTLDRSKGGLGLGLTVVRRLVELHGGSISASSEGHDRGASFTLRLPRAAEVPQSRAVRDLAAPLRPKRIVLVEDNGDNRDAVAAVLRMLGHHVTVAADGRDGVAAILASRPDIALVDLGLPGIDGFQVARQVRAAADGNRVFLVALTGYGGEVERENALAAGFDVFLTKPFDRGKFEAAARMATTKEH